MLWRRKIKGGCYWTGALRKAFLTEWLLRGSLKMKEYSCGQVLLVLSVSPPGMPSPVSSFIWAHMFFKSQYKGHTSFLIILTLPFKKKSFSLPSKNRFSSFQFIFSKYFNRDVWLYLPRQIHQYPLCGWTWLCLSGLLKHIGFIWA